MWRKAAGVEPTRERLTPPTGFEARPYHPIRMPSFVKRMQRQLQIQAHTPMRLQPFAHPAIEPQQVRVSLEASISNAIEELQNLDRALAPQ